MRSSLQNPRATWQGLGLAISYDPSDRINLNRPGWVAAELVRLGGGAPVVALLRLLASYQYDGGEEQLLLDAICDAPDAFDWYSV